MDKRIRSSRRQETRVARALAGRRTPGSGNGWITKNDVKSARWSIECKTTEKKSFTLKGADLRLAERNALLENRDMAFVIDMEDRSWVVVSFEVFAELAEEN